MMQLGVRAADLPPTESSSNGAEALSSSCHHHGHGHGHGMTRETQ
jgi:hypothetical protein